MWQKKPHFSQDYIFTKFNIRDSIMLHFMNFLTVIELHYITGTIHIQTNESVMKSPTNLPCLSLMMIYIFSWFVLRILSIGFMFSLTKVLSTDRKTMFFNRVPHAAISVPNLDPTLKAWEIDFIEMCFV